MNSMSNTQSYPAEARPVGQSQSQPKALPVPEAMNRLNDSLARLGSITDSLGDRLGPVLSPEPDAKPDAPDNPHSSPLHGQLLLSVDRVDRVSDRLSALLRTLTI